MNAYKNLTKQQLLDLVASLEAQIQPPLCGPIDKDPTIWETPTFPDTPDDVPASATPEAPKPAAAKLRGYEVYVNGVLKHTIIIPTNEQEACRRANWIAKQAAIRGWPTRVKSIIVA